MQPPLYPFQKKALLHLRQKIHLVCISPTGSGKSRIYEEYLRRNPTHKAVLISPLLALSRQQKERVKILGLESRIQILSPESLLFEQVQRRLVSFSPDLLVVDEAHLVLEWGSKFRPSFRKIFSLLKNLKIRKSLWLSATLTDQATQDIQTNIEEPIVTIGRFQFPEKLEITKIKISLSERFHILQEFLQQQKGQGILFVATRTMADRIEKQFGVRSYHAGLSREERIWIENEFKMGQFRWIVATSAFGLGVDMPNLESVVIFQVPFSLLTLVQMMGRVGRGKNAGRALVFWSDEDFQITQNHDRQIFDALLSKNFREYTEKSLGSYCHQVETC